LSFDELLKRAGGFEQLFKEAREGGVNLEREVQRALRKDSLLFRTVGYTVLKMGTAWSKWVSPSAGP
jgi:hypothetical protein